MKRLAFQIDNTTNPAVPNCSGCIGLDSLTCPPWLCEPWARGSVHHWRSKWAVCARVPLNTNHREKALFERDISALVRDIPVKTVKKIWCVVLKHLKLLSNNICIFCCIPVKFHIYMWKCVNFHVISRYFHTVWIFRFFLHAALILNQSFLQRLYSPCRPRRCWAMVQLQRL